MLSGNRIPDRSHEHYGYSLAIMKVFWHVEGEAFVVSRRRRWNGREPWLAQPGPHFLGRNGGKNPRGKRFFPLDSLLWWVCGGRLYFSLVTWPAALTLKGP